jgi:hypothetical protein
MRSGIRHPAQPGRSRNKAWAARLSAKDGAVGEAVMNARNLLWLAALLPWWTPPASATVVIDQAEVAGGALIVTGQVSPPVRTVTLGVGPLASIILQPDVTGRFAWIGKEIPPGCTVSVFAGTERADAGIGRCGSGAPPYPVPAGVSTYGAGGYWSGAVPGPGIGVDERPTTRTTVRAPVISPNDPRYAQTEPPHWGQPEEQGWRSGELLYPHGFYGPVRSKESGL